MPSIGCLLEPEKVVKNIMRLGAPPFSEDTRPESWIKALKERGYRAAPCPVGYDAQPEQINAFRTAASEHDIVIAEVGCWSNPMSDNTEVREKAIEHCKRSLALAEQIRAGCCVNIVGSRSADSWAGPDPRDLSDETFEQVVSTCREIIDAVNPQHTCFAVETMPWMHPSSVDDCLRLVDAVDRPAFGIHFDFINLLNCHALAYNPIGLIEDAVSRLGSFIKAVHFKDYKFGDGFPVHILECPPGQGILDCGAAFKALEPLGDNMPVLLEHMNTDEQYRAAAAHLRSVNGLCLSKPPRTVYRCSTT